jgi:predicted TIM-barrel fold metal-dependent hydrolase
MPRYDSPLSRRAYLALAGASITWTAGCSGDGGDETDRPTTETAGTGTATAMTRTTAATARTTDRTDTATPTDAPTPTETETPTDTRTATETETGTETPTEIERMESELSEVSFEGTYFDTHVHWPDNAIVSEYAPRMNEHDIGATALFSPSRKAERNYEEFLREVTEPDAEYLPFMSAPPPGNRLDDEEFDDLYEKAEPAFWGIGEFKPQGNAPPEFTEEPLAGLFELAGELGVPVMYHPYPSQEGTIEDGLSEYSDTDFLLHGHQMLSMGEQNDDGHGKLLPRLLEEYDNLYWTADVATMLGGQPYIKDSAEAFIEWYDSEKSQRDIDRSKTMLSNLLEAGPEKVMWGTDVGKEWHTEDGVIERFVDATERVLEGIPEKHHAPFKHENALAFFDVE